MLLLLTPFQDYFDENQSGKLTKLSYYYNDQMSRVDKSKEAIGAALYATLCSIFFSISISHMSVELRCTVSGPNYFNFWYFETHIFNTLHSEMHPTGLFNLVRNGRQP